RLDRTLFETELRFRSLVEQSPEAIVLHTDGEIVYVNPAAARLLGFTDATELVGGSLLDRMHPASRELAAERLDASAVGTQRSETLEYRVMHTDGRVLDVE